MEDLYSKDDLYYNKYTDKLFSGSIEDENTTGIIEMEAAIFNQKKILVFSGFHKYLIKKKFINVKN